ncbi:PREDICTED: protein NRT1/ PTR FAMILY 5.6-like [Populus euphratica]|uniref:Protein NRT1/ PTR FAMILY 5.6-like n=1 Tax=Populus euphratica TaxID=75702 RepID=A0AAJ6UWQ9_POPEU|nr:PREDICTED: protein NRT1/ PTR FAMILY 5.6-like [Populus euphratica]XP_011037018.1 PREDICTED: protein NRT1/ PTR FAMILY 5.6-like [Populus euphratica]
MEQPENRKVGREAKESDEEEKWVHDSSVDYKGRVPLRSSTGVWTASLFIITIEFSERLSNFGITANLISYLTKVIHQDLKTAAKSVNYWAGVTTMMPLFGGFLADAYTGRFSMVLLSSLVYLLGLSLLTMSQFIPSLQPCDVGECEKARKIHEVVFFLAMYSISLGTGGHKPCLQSFGADQFDDDHAEERKKKLSYFNWWNIALCCGLVLGVTVIVYIEDNISWGVAILILTITMAVTVATFYMGKPYYRYRLPEGSGLTSMLQVLVAAVRKRTLPSPSNPALLYEVPSYKIQGRLLGHTDRLTFLDKAAVLEEEEVSNEVKHNPWRLATVTKVEEMKLVLNIIPIWLTSLPFGLCVVQTATFFVKQGATLNRKIGHNFEIPPASIFSLSAVGMIISVVIYDKILVPFLRRATGNERGISILKRIGSGMIFSVASMSVAALVERKRQKIAEEDINVLAGEKNVELPMSVFWLAPQFLILGLGDGFTLVGLQEFFYDQVPDSMRSLGMAFFLSVLGAGNFLSSFLITTVDHITEKDGKGWIGKDLNSSRLDKFYWLLAAINSVNIFVYVLFARRYTYKTVQRRLAATNLNKDDGMELMP